MDDRIRASDADRDRVTARLRENFAEGRLSQDELEERINDALNAKTFGDLRQVMIDLPEPAPAPRPAGPMAGPAPYQMSPYRRRRGPRLFPLLMIGVFVAFAASGGGAAAVAVKLAALTALVTVALFLFLAYLGGRLFHRGQQDWNRGQHHHGHQQGHWYHHHRDGWSRW